MANRDAALDELVRYDGIERHPGWEALREDFALLEKQYAERLARSLMRTGAPIDQRKVDRWAGFFEGARWILSRPLLAEDTLKKALELEQEGE